MVNAAAFTERLNHIMNYYDLSAASFADKIDVGRSSISHLLSGRNKPSLDFVLKIVTAFPEVELYWLLNGKGSFPKKISQPAGPPIAEKILSQTKQQDLFTEIQEPPLPIPETKARNIHKIVIFYKDGSFEAFEN